MAGFIQEILVTSYHRAVTTNKIATASILTMIVGILSILVIAEVTRKIFDPSFGFLSYIFVLVFASGKGIGAYLSLKKLHKW